MENFVVSARKYRPQKFNDVVGQSSITDTLENAIKSGHLAQAFLFCGPRGVGKTTCARILAKVVNTKEGEEIDPNEDFGFNIFELDAASNNSVDDIRSLTDQVRIPPQVGDYKVYIIDEAHMLSQAAFNAFLKTLEEPPAHAIFILATTEKHKIIPTILSRCQIFDFKRIDVKDMEKHLSGIATQEGIEAESDALHLIAEKADGALRDALSIFDQIISFAGNKLSYKAVVENLNILDYDYFFRASDYIRKHDIPAALVLFDEILNKGFDGHHFINGLGTHYRNLLVCKDESSLALLQVGDNIRAKYLEQSKNISQEDLLLGLKLIARTDVEYKASKNQRLLVEISLMQLCSIGVEHEKKKTLADRIDIIPYHLVSKSREPKVLDEYQEETPSKPPKAEIQKEEPKASSEKSLERKPEMPSKETEAKPETVESESVPEPIAKAPVSTNSNTLKVSSLSIGAFLEEEEQVHAEEEEDLSGKPKDSFTKEQLLEQWKNYANKIQKEGKRSFASMLLKYEPERNENTVLISLDNKAQLNEYNACKQGLLNNLRDALNNYSIALDYTLEVKKEKRKYYTNREKFDRMVELNPSLLDFQKELGLDPDI